MKTAADYDAQADHARGLAEKATSAAERREILKIAEVWAKLAEERRRGRIDKQAGQPTPSSH